MDDIVQKHFLPFRSGNYTLVCDLLLHTLQVSHMYPGTDHNIYFGDKLYLWDNLNSKHIQVDIQNMDRHYNHAGMSICHCYIQHFAHMAMDCKDL